MAQTKHDQRQRGRYLGGKVPFGFEKGADGALVENAEEQAIIMHTRDLKAGSVTLRGIQTAVEVQYGRSTWSAVQVVRRLIPVATTAAQGPADEDHRMTGRTAAERRQLDLFLMAFGEVPLRDEREGMSVLLVSLSKTKRTAPIVWASPPGAKHERWVRVTANATHGMATIWDFDVVIWAVSQLNAAVDAGRPVSPALRFHAHDLLRAIGRGVGGKDYVELEAALNRLAGTLVETNIRGEGRRRAWSFHLLEEWKHDVDEPTGRSLGMTLTLPRWLYEGVVKHRDVLAVSPEYFDLSSGIARFLYRIARRHGGKQEAGWRFTMKELHARSGSTQPMKEFARGVRKVVRAQGVPEYRLDLVQGQAGDEVLSMVRDGSKAGLPQRRDLAKTPTPS